MPRFFGAGNLGRAAYQRGAFIAGGVMPEQRATNLDEKQTPLDKCDPDCAAGPNPGGPVREAGGTTGAGNLSPGGASRTGGATTGVADGESPRSRDIPPSA